LHFYLTMAISYEIAVPPSLQTLYAELLKSSLKTGQSKGLVSFQPSIQMSFSTASQKPLQALATQAATWLRNQWKPKDKSQFYADRRAEVLGGSFNGTYWRECTKVSDWTAYSIPIVQPYRGSVNPGYFDGTRRPSKSKWVGAERWYNTPASETDPANPFPGWHGEIWYSFWHDQYLAQRHQLFMLPYSMTKTDKRPIAILFTGNISADSSTRGNTAWFQLSSNKLYRPLSTSPSIGDFKPIGNWSTTDTRTLILPGATNYGWNHLETINLVRNGRTQAKWVGSNGINSVLIKIIIPPPNGFMFSLNDWATVRHRVTARVFVGVGPNG